MQLTVETKYGVVEGIPGNNAAVAVFKGIPYAAPPVGAMRFMPPQQPESWEGVRKCHEFSKISLQPKSLSGLPFSDFFRKEFYPVEYPQSGDSLYLNIWTAAASEDDRLPVMFWIHGGGLTNGYGHEMEFDGEAMAKKGVILVTINFRLGYVGFFAHPELSKRNEAAMGKRVSGNNTLLDLIQGLKWVRENIRFFGGDPDNVTVFGQSGGAAATRALLASPLADGLFHKAIIQSGISGIDLNLPFGHDTLEYAENWGVKALEVLGMTLEELENLPEDQVIEKLEYAERNGAGKKCGETKDDYVLPVFPPAAAANGSLRDVPIMTGCVHGDKGGMFSIPEFEGHPMEEAAFKYLGDKYQSFIEKYPIKEHQPLYQYMIANEVYYDMLSFAEAQSRHGKSAPYLYYFDTWMPGEIESKFVPEGESFHSSELWFMFGTLGRCWRNFDGRYYELSDKMVSYWTNFARCGNPNGPGLPVWKPCLPGQRNFIHLNENVVENESRDHVELELIFRHFWDNE